MSIYKGENMISGGSVDTHFVRKPAWSQAVTISVADIAAGYTAPSDGMIVGALYNSVVERNDYFTLNGTGLMPLLSLVADRQARPLTLSLTVNQGDIIGCTAPSANIIMAPALKFVPFEDSTVSDVEVVPPGLIRNLHDPDWANAVDISTEQLYTGYTAPSDGMFVCSFVAPPSGTPSIRIIAVNAVPIAKGRYRTETEYSYGGSCCPVSKDDLIKANSNSAWGGETRYFVPYKRQ